VFSLYFRAGWRAQNALLLVASYFFYGCWDWRFLSLIILSTVIDYSVGLAIDSSDSPRRRKLLLWVSMASNLGILGFFKYFGFFSSELDRLLTSVGIPGMMPTFSFILPVGISFY